MLRVCGAASPRSSLKAIAGFLSTRSKLVTGSSHAGITCSTSEKSQNLSAESRTLKHVYDILNCGPRNRFTVLSDKGPLVVHNCHLGLGFGAGAATFQKVAKLMGGVTLSLDESLDVVNKWRRLYQEIANGWRNCHEALADIYIGNERAIDPWGLCWTCREGIRTPKGLIRYPNLRQELKDDGKKEWVYGEGRHKARIYAGKVTENIVQHLARCVIADNALAVQKAFGLSPALMVHDELVYVVGEEHSEDALAAVQKTMRTPPIWWPDLITWSEGDIADTYGSAK